MPAQSPPFCVDTNHPSLTDAPLVIAGGHSTNILPCDVKQSSESCPRQPAPGCCTPHTHMAQIRLFTSIIFFRHQWMLLRERTTTAELADRCVKCAYLLASCVFIKWRAKERRGIFYTTQIIAINKHNGFGVRLEFKFHSNNVRTKWNPAANICLSEAAMTDLKVANWSIDTSVIVFRSAIVCI